MKSVAVILMLTAGVAEAKKSEPMPPLVRWPDQKPEQPQAQETQQDAPQEQGQPEGGDKPPTEQDINDAAWKMATQIAKDRAAKYAFLKHSGEFKYFAIGPFMGTEFATRGGGDSPKMTMLLGLEAHLNLLGYWDIGVFNLVARFGGVYNQTPDNFPNYRDNFSRVIEIGSRFNMGPVMMGAGWSNWTSSYDAAEISGTQSIIGVKSESINGGYIDARYIVGPGSVGGRCRMGNVTTWSPTTSIGSPSTKDGYFGAWCGVTMGLILW